MSIYESHRRKIIWTVVVLFFGLVIFGGKIKHQETAAARETKTVTHLPYKTIYKTIPDPDNAIGLIAFELHEDVEYTDGNETYPTFSVVVKNIDSQSDNYKALCKDIVADVVNTCGDEQVIVNIYDSFEAYSLERLYEEQGKLLSREEEDTINNHRVATYAYEYADNGDKVFHLTYYPDAKNSLRENEVYTPDKYLP